MKIIALRSKIS